MSCIRLDAITVDTDNSTLIIENGYVNITDTSISSNSITGSLVLDGGLGINCSTDAINSTNGGALTVGGGASINGKMYLGSDLTLDSTLSTISVNGILYPRFFLDTINNQKLEISLDGINKHFILNNTSLTLAHTSESSSITSGAMIVNGGISIRCTSDASSVTCGGSLTIGGGCSIFNDVYIGDSIYISGGSLYTNEINSDQTGDGNLNIISANYNITSDNIVITTDNYTINEQVIINNTSSSFNNTVYLNNTSANESLSVNGNISFNSTKNASSNTDGGSLTIMGGTSIQKDAYIGGNIYTNNNIYFFNSNGNSLSSLVITSAGNLILNSQNTSGTNIIFNSSFINVSSGSLYLKDYFINSTNSNLNITSLVNTSTLNLFTTHKDGLDDNYVYIYGYNQTTGNSTEYLKLGYSSSTEVYTLTIDKSGSGLLRDFILGNENGKFTLTTNGSLSISSTTVSSNSSSGALLLNGGLSINCTNNSNSVTSGGAMSIAGGISIQKDTYLGGNLYLHNDGTTSNLIIPQTFNITSNTSNNATTNVHCNNIAFYSYGGITSGNYENLQIIGSSGYSLSTNAGGTGLLHYLKIQTGSNDNQLFLATNGNIGINNSNPNYSLDINGSIHSNNSVISVNVNVSNNITSNNLLINNNAQIKNDVTIDNNLYTYKNIIFYGTANATSFSNGSLNIYGGTGIRKDLYVGGIVVSNSSGSFKTLTLTSTSGTCLTLDGNLLINSTTNSTNVSNGGAVTILGGVSIIKDTYIGGNCSFNNSINIINANNFLNIYDSFNILRFGLNYNNENLSFARYNSSSIKIEDVITFNNTTGTTTFNNTTSSLNSSIGSVVLLGGLNINCTTNASNVSNGGSLTVAGGVSLASDVYIGGNIHLMSTTISNNNGSGALIVNGGAGITGNVNVGGNVIVTGNLTVNGSTTNVQTVNTTITDNIMVLNSGPSGSHDAGFIIQRYQIGNDTGSGDVVTDNPYVIDILANQTGIGSPSNQIKLSFLTSVINDYYTNWWIRVETGFSSNQCRQIISYDGTTHIATLNSPWTTQNPGSGDTVYLYNKPYVGIIYNELLNVFQFGSTTIDPGQSNVAFTDNIGISFDKGNCSNTTPSTNITTGGLILAGGLAINCTTNAISSTNGGGLTISGGAAIQKSLYIGNSLNVNNVNLTPNSYDVFTSITYNALNNQLDIPFITINNNVWGFDLFLAVKIAMTNSNDNLYCNFNIRGVNKSSSWEIITNYIGDDTGIEFNISTENATNNGLIEYSTPDYGITISSITFKYRIFTN